MKAANVTTVHGLIHTAADAHMIVRIVMQNPFWISGNYGMRRNRLLQISGRLEGRLQNFQRVQSSGLAA